MYYHVYLLVPCPVLFFEVHSLYTYSARFQSFFFIISMIIPEMQLIKLPYHMPVTVQEPVRTLFIFKSVGPESLKPAVCRL